MKKGIKLSDDHKKKIAMARKGKSSGMKGKIPWNKGKTTSDEVKKKISVAKMKKVGE